MPRTGDACRTIGDKGAMNRAPTDWAGERIRQMATISSTTSSAHVAGRHIFGNALHLAGALVVVFGSVGFASFAARWILNGVPHAASSVHHAASSVPPAA